MQEDKRAILALEDGTVFFGKGFGAETEVSGEVVFNTSMYGYPELLTDPSYYEQIVVMTYPIIGSYGVPSFSLRDSFGVPLHFESESVKVRGYVVHSLSRPSHWAAEKRLEDWLLEEGVPGICGIDTRALTKRIRMNGTMLGVLKVSSQPFDVGEASRTIKTVTDPNRRDLVAEVSPREPVFHDGKSAKRVVVIDCGVKLGIVRSLLAEGVSVVRVPHDYDAEKIMDLEPAGVVISNGPGDPAMCKKTVESARDLIESDLPIMGVCLGSQILALAGGAETFKLKFGHRAVNHPCVDLETGRCYITTQNHGFSVREDSLNGTDFKASFLNANDKSVEGIKHKVKSVFGVQWHPESSPGPYDTRFLFNRFLEDMLA